MNVLYLLYRGSVSFLITARADGEFVDNSQVLMMMKMSLSLVWISIIQHILYTAPMLHRSQKEQEETNEIEVKPIEDYSLQRNNSTAEIIKDGIYSFMVRSPTETTSMESLLHGNKSFTQ